MIKTILWFSYFWIYQIRLLSSFFRLKFLIKRGRREEARSLVNKIVPRWAKGMVKFTGSEVEMIGGEKLPEEPVLFVSNHQGSFDIPLLLGYIDKPKAFIAKWELRYLPFIGSWMKELGCIFIKRDDFRQTLRAFKSAGEIFKKGQSLVIFPEGTRSRSSRLGDFKRGSLKIALRENVPIVPVTIKGSYNLKEANNGLIKGANVQIVISDPIYVNKLTKEQRNDLTLIVRDRIKEQL